MINIFDPHTGERLYTDIQTVTSEEIDRCIRDSLAEIGTTENNAGFPFLFLTLQNIVQLGFDDEGSIDFDVVYTQVKAILPHHESTVDSIYKKILNI